MRELFTRHLFAGLLVAMVIASIAIGYKPDDWSNYDHRQVRVVGVLTGDSLRVVSSNGKLDTVKLLGIKSVESAQGWLNENVAGREVTLLLESPQTRDLRGRLLAHAFLEHQDLGVELTRNGLAYAHRSEKSEMAGLIGAAQSEARKKKRGVWAELPMMKNGRRAAKANAILDRPAEY